MRRCGGRIPETGRQPATSANQTTNRGIADQTITIIVTGDNRATHPTKTQFMLSIFIVVVLAIMFLGAVPAWPHSRNWGYYPSGGLGLILFILVILLLLGRI